MKKAFILAAVAALALTSCVEEKSFRDRKLGGENDVAFVLQGGAATRAGGVGAPVRTGKTIPVTKVDGVEIFLEETVTDMNIVTAETKGSPLYTENLGLFYGDKLGVRAGDTGNNPIDAVYALEEEEPTTDGWLFSHYYTTDVWPANDGVQNFYLRVPSDVPTSVVTSYNTAEGVATVGYTSPATAEATTDIAFGGIQMSKSQYQTFFKQSGGAKVTLYHALTGVKFALANSAAEVANIQINKITFTGLKNSGEFTFTTSTKKINWTSSSVSGTSVISQEFGEGDFVTEYTTGNNPYKFGSTFYDGGTKQNINDAAASKTFWLVPQATTDSPADSPAKLKIEYTINGTDEWFEIDVKDLTTSNWQAGQLRTYTFKINQVNVKIDDRVKPAGTAEDGYKGSVKDSVVITNTGNTRAFIRAALVGQWLDSNGDPVFGFTDRINQLYLVESWYEDQFKNNTHNHGEFIGLAGYKDGTKNTTGANPYNGWVLCEDGYYYYTKAVAPDGTTASLFEKYTVKQIPNSQIAGQDIPNASMHFSLEIATQAIAANQLDGTVKQTGEGDEKEDDWKSAWAKALGTAPVEK